MPLCGRNWADSIRRIVSSTNWPGELDLQVAPRLANADAVVLAEALEQLNTLLQHAVPGVAVRVMEPFLLARRPFAKQDSGWVFAQEVGRQGLFEGAPEEHGS